MATTDLVTCGKFDTSQAAQDAAILALQNGSGVTAASVSTAVNAMTPAQLAAMCAKLNCQPTTAALTAALMALAGSGTAGNVLTIVGGAPVWQAPVAGAATTVPATGITAGAIGAGVTLPASQVTGLAAAISGAVDGSETKVTAGANITVTGSGTVASPYVITPTGGGSAASVPASGITAGALGAGVTTTPASVVGFDAAALAAVPTATDTVQGKVSLAVAANLPSTSDTEAATPAYVAAAIAANPASVPTATDTTQGKVAINLGTAAGDATNPTDALTAAGLAAILNGVTPNTSPNALQAAVASNPSQYGTFASVLAPTAAPTAANPATRLTNTNGEVFDWTGTAWVYTAKTTDVAAANSFVATSGWQRLPSGIIFQWGRFISATTFGGPITANFNIAFPNGCGGVILTAQDSTSTTRSAWVESFSTTSFVGRANTPTQFVYWFAIGF